MFRHLSHIDAFLRQSKTLEQALAAPGNLFTPVRLVLALAVLVGHSFVVTYGPGTPEPLMLFNLTLSYVAVNGFFIVSGMFITRSIDRNPDLIRFFCARALRLYPAMVVMVLLASFVFGPMVSQLSWLAYLADPQLWHYVCDVVSFGDTSGGPPEIFSGNPWSGEWSASLWTLRYEAIAYVGTAVLAMSGLLRRRTVVLGLFVLCVAVFALVRSNVLDAPPQLFDLSRFAITYLLGAVLYVFRSEIRLSWTLGAFIIGVALCFGSLAPFEIMLNFALAMLLVLIGFANVPGRVFLSKMPDVSYGVYIWQWPVMQSIWYFDISHEPLLIMALSAPISIGLGALSWVLLEKPALGLKQPLANWLRRTFTAYKTA